MVAALVLALVALDPALPVDDQLPMIDDEAGVLARVMRAGAFLDGEPLPEPPPAHLAWPWYDLALCESGPGEPRWHVDTGNGYYGGLQFDLESWGWAVEAGGHDVPARPDGATPAQQVAVAETLLDIHPAGWGAWPACSARLGLR